MIIKVDSINAKLNGVVSRGIKAAEIDENGHLIFTLTDDSTVDLGMVIGNGIASIAFKETDSSGGNVYTITFTDGTAAEFTAPKGSQGIQGIQGVQGVPGEQGDTGNGISSAILNSDYTLTINFTDGTSYTTPSIRGAQGIQGIQGETGETGETGVSVTNYELISGNHAAGTFDTYRMTLSSGVTFDCKVWNGANGEGAGDMMASLYDPQGMATDIFGYVDDSINDNAVKKTGDTMTGKLVVPQVETGDDESSYFQARKFRGEGDANTYYHAVDFGHLNHDQVDFYEYGGLWNFWQSRAAVKNASNLCGKITVNGWEGDAKLTGTPTAPTAETGTNTTQIATTEFVQSSMENKADLVDGKVPTSQLPDTATDIGVFIATYGTTTSAEIEAAYQAGKAVFCLDKDISVGDSFIPLSVRVSATEHIFAGTRRVSSSTSGGYPSFTQAKCVNDSWDYYTTSTAAPYTHASTHASGGTDPITPADIGAAPLGDDGKIIATYIPYISHAAQHASGGADPITPDSIGASKIESGTYTGTGYYSTAVSGATVINTSFKPSVVFVYYLGKTSDTSDTNMPYAFAVLTPTRSLIWHFGSSAYCKPVQTVFSDTSVKFYGYYAGNGADEQLNSSGVPYGFIAFS